MKITKTLGRWSNSLSEIKFKNTKQPSYKKGISNTEANNSNLQEFNRKVKDS